MRPSRRWVAATSTQGSGCVCACACSAVVVAQAAQAGDDDDDDEDDDGSGRAGGGGAGSSVVDGMTYDQLLELSARIGDVAKERWALQAPAFIATLPRFVHQPSAASAACDDPHSTTANALGESCDRYGCASNNIAPCCDRVVRGSGGSCATVGTLPTS